MVVGLNAGHTKSGPGSGAIGIIKESDETRAVVKELTKLLKEMSVKVVDCTIDKAVSQSACLAAITAQANRQDLDWFISVHFNAGGGQGTECYTYKGRQYADAIEITENIAALGFRNRGVKDGTGFYVVNKTKAKCVLIEVCFVDTEDASKYLKLGAKKIAEAIVSALANYIVPKSVEQVKAKVPVQAQLEQKNYVKVIVDKLTVRKSLAWEGNEAGIVRKNEVFTVISDKLKAGNGYMYKLKSGLYITASEKYVKFYSR